MAANAELAHLQAPCSLPECLRFYQRLMGDRLSSTAWVLGKPSVREVLNRPDGRWFRTSSLGKVLVIYELSVVHRPTQLPSSRNRPGGAS